MEMECFYKGSSRSAVSDMATFLAYSVLKNGGVCFLMLIKVVWLYAYTSFQT